MSKYIKIFLVLPAILLSIGLFLSLKVYKSKHTKYKIGDCLEHGSNIKEIVVIDVGKYNYMFNVCSGYEGCFVVVANKEEFDESGPNRVSCEK